MDFWKNVSLKGKVFFFTLLGGLLTLILAMSIFYFSLSESMEEQIASQAMDIAQLAAARIDARNHYTNRQFDKLQAVAEMIRRKTNAAFVVYMDMAGVRHSHPNSELIGKKFTGDDEGPVMTGHSYTSKAVGISGPSIRAFVPVYDFREQQVGAVAVGFYEPDIQVIMSRVFNIFYIVIPIGFFSMAIVSFLLSHNIKRSMFGMEPREIATLLKERETMLQSAREGIIAIDKDYKITVINQAAEKLFNPNTELIGQPIHSVLPESRLPLVMETQQAEYDQTMLINRTVVLTNRIPMVLKGEVIGAIATFRDLTEVNRLAEELTGVRKVVNALRAKTHEFMNKMHVVSGLIQLGDYAEAQKYILSFTSQEQTFISFIIDNIRNPAAAGLLVGKTSEAKEMQVKLLIDPNSSLHYLPDHFNENSFAVVLGNLIENAYQAVADMPAKRRVVELLLHHNHYNIVIKVRDYGSGIDESIRAKIFEQGFTTKKTGTGFGLNNLYHRVEMAQGTVQFETGENGTTFTVVIPNVVN